MAISLDLPIAEKPGESRLTTGAFPQDGHSASQKTRRFLR